MSKFRKALSTGATALLVVCALAITALAVRRELFAPRPVAVQAARTVPDWERLTRDGRLLGPVDAPIKIVEFSDFQCPFCAQAVQEIHRLRARDPQRVAVVYRHFPIQSIHPHAFAAALASECAGEQDRFEAYHDALFAAQPGIGTRTWSEFAADAGVPSLDEFDRCVREERFAANIRRDMAAASAVGVNGTPTFIFNGVMRSGLPGVQLLHDEIRKALAK